jgi:hypothetical protein
MHTHTVKSVYIVLSMSREGCPGYKAERFFISCECKTDLFCCTKLSRSLSNKYSSLCFLNTVLRVAKLPVIVCLLEDIIHI